MAWKQRPCLRSWRGKRLEPEARYRWSKAEGDLYGHPNCHSTVGRASGGLIRGKTNPNLSV